MEELRENRNPFMINGYLGRKWYLILGLIITLILICLQLILCPNIFKETVILAQNDTSFSIISLLRSGRIEPNQVFAYTIIFVCGIILSFINNKKRITDLTGTEKKGYLISSFISLLTLMLAFATVNTFLYSALTLLSSLAGILLLIIPGKLVIPLYETPVETNSDKVETKSVVSFWRRWAAYIIDASFILAPVSMFISMMFYDFFYKLGNVSMFFGFILFLLYFGIMNSKITKGQTLGKIALQIKVVNKDGNYLSLPKSLIRAFIFSLCVLAPVAFINLYTTNQQLIYSIGTIIAITLALGAIFDCLFLFNLKTRQSIHDLFAGSYVVTTKSHSALCNYKTSPAPVIAALIPGILTGLILFAGIKAYNTQIQTNESLIKNLETTKNIEKTFDVTYLKSFYSAHAPYSIFIETENINDETLANNIGKYILNNSKQHKIEQVNVILQKNINMGNIVNNKLKSYKVDK